MVEVKKRYSLEELAEVTYYQSQFAYRKFNWAGLNYPLEDFQQDAVLHILELYERDYFEYREDGSIQALVYKLLSGFFAYNKLMEKTNERNMVISLDYMEEFANLNGIDNYTNPILKDLDSLNPEEQYNSINSLNNGKTLYNEILEAFKSMSLERQTSHKYSAIIDNKETDLSYYVLAKLVLGKTKRIDIVNLFSKGNKSKEVYVRRQLNKVLGFLKSIVENLSPAERNDLKNFVLP